MSVHHLNEEEKGFALWMRMSGYRLLEIADFLGVSMQTICILCKNEGVKKEQCREAHGNARPTSERNQEICRLRREGITLAEIGIKFKITRERVRQVCKKDGVKKPPKAPAPLFPIKWFRLTMVRHLHACGYYRCGPCDAWLPGEDFSCLRTRRCRKCTARYVNEWYHKNHSRSLKAAREYRRANKDKTSLYGKRYREKRKKQSGGSAC